MKFIVKKKKVLEEFKTLTQFVQKYNLDANFMYRKLGKEAIRKVPSEYLTQIKTVYLPNLEVVNHPSKADYIIKETSEGLRLVEATKDD